MPVWDCKRTNVLENEAADECELGADKPQKWTRPPRSRENERTDGPRGSKGGSFGEKVRSGRDGDEQSYRVTHDWELHQRRNVVCRSSSVLVQSVMIQLDWPIITDRAPSVVMMISDGSLQTLAAALSQQQATQNPMSQNFHSKETNGMPMVRSNNNHPGRKEDNTKKITDCGSCASHRVTIRASETLASRLITRCRSRPEPD
jgi:hypothetical protein